MIVGRTFYFDSAHRIIGYDGACERFHGHTYRLDVEVEGDVKKDGMVVDFNKIKKHVKEKVIEKLDHRDLNQVLDNPTAEHIVEWIWAELSPCLNLYSIRIWEGDGKWAKKVKK